MKRLRGLLGDVSAATAVEFALLATPFVALVLASLQLSIMFYAGQCLQSATIMAGRQLMTGADQQAGFSQAQFRTAVCNDANFLFNCNNIMVDVQSSNGYSSLNTAPITLTYNAQGKVNNAWSYSPGGAGDIVIVRVMYNWPVVGGPLAVGLANEPNGDHLLVGTSVFKNEPY